MSRNLIKDNFREQRLFRARVLISASAVTLLLLLLLLHLARLQIENHSHYTTLSQDNRVKLEPLPPTRGLVYDRNGVILAENLPTHSLEITPEQVEQLDQTLSELEQILEIRESDHKRFQKLLKQRRRFESIPIRTRLNETEVARFAVNQHRFPGVSLKADPLRHYPVAEEIVHVLGYVGRINKEEVLTLNTTDYSGTDYIGKTGVEKFYEETLHGTVGHQQVEINVVGRPIRVLESTPPIAGENLHLSIDIRLQKLAYDALGDNNGAIVAIDPRNGSVLLMVSKPGFDPNPFVEGISAADYKTLRESESKPLFNRVLRGRYPPGSTVKPFIGLAGLESGVVDTTTKIFCRGYYQLPGLEHKYRDWLKSGHGWTNLEQAIVESCDVYYYDLAKKLGIDRIHTYLSQFGFGIKSGIDISGDLTGLLPSRQWKKKARKAPWYIGETLIVGIGQGYFLATPLELASATATLAARGLRYPPRVVHATSNQDAPARENLILPQGTLLTDLKRYNIDHIIHAMAGVVEGKKGTARRILSDRYRIAGKTGTAQVFSVAQDEEYNVEELEKKMQDHALFVAFAPVEEPRIAVAVVVENGGSGSAVAAPIARQIMDRFMLGETP
jgi:penicillin-binding protein 2